MERPRPLRALRKLTGREEPAINTLFSTQDAVVAILILIPTAPLAVGLITFLGRRSLPASVSAWMAAAGTAASFAATIAIIFLSMRQESEVAVLSWTLGRWFSFPGLTPHSVEIGLTFDELSSVVLAAMMFSATCMSVSVASSHRNDSSNRTFAWGTSLIVFAGSMSLLAPNFLQFFVFWQLAAIAMFALGRNPATAEPWKSPGSFVANHSTDLVFLLGLLFVWNNFTSFDFSEIVGWQGTPPEGLTQFLDVPNDPELLGYRLATISLICLCLLIAAVGRCGQFPLFGRTSDVSAVPASTDGLMRAIVIIPTGVFLLARSRLLFAYAGEIQPLLLLCGGLTTVIAPISAATENDLKRVLGLVATAFCGWTFIGLGSGTSLGYLAALLLLCVSMAGIASLFLIARHITTDTAESAEFSNLGGMRKRFPVECWSFLLVALVLASGLWGQNAILSSLAARFAESSNAAANEDATDRAVDSESQESESGQSAIERPTLLAAMFPVLGAASLLVTSFALFRAFFLAFHHESPTTKEKKRSSSINDRQTRSQTRPSPWLPPMMAMALAGAAALIGPLLAGAGGALMQYAGETLMPWESPPQRELFQVEYGSLLSLMGLVGAWMMFASPSPWPARFAKLLAPLVRLGEHRFYLDDVWNHIVVVPLRGLAQVCRFAEWLVLEQLMGALSRWVSSEIEEASRRMETGLVQFYALSLVLATTVLLVVVSWLRG